MTEFLNEDQDAEFLEALMKAMLEPIDDDDDTSAGCFRWA